MTENKINFFEMGFPYPNIREGQQIFMEKIIKVLKNKENLIACAPTGIGKTAASLTPTIEYSIKNNKKIIVLTSRQTQLNQILKTIREISKKREQHIRYSGYISKQNTCVHPQFLSSKKKDFSDFCKDKKEKRQCEYFLNMSNENLENFKIKILEEANKEENFQTIEKFISFVGCESREQVINDKTNSCNFCPYEMMGLNSQKSKVIVCDYNHIFKTKLRELLLGKAKIDLENVILIIDEAHNLQDRIKNLFSKKINFEILQNFKSECDKFYENKKIGTKIFNCLKLVLENIYLKIKKNNFTNQKKILIETKTFLDLLESELTKINLNYEELIIELESISKIVFLIRTKSYAKSIFNFLKIWKKLQGENFVKFLEIDGYASSSKFDLSLNIKLIDPSILTKSILENTHSTILMSATLNPLEMNKNILGIEKAEEVDLESPFEKKNHLVLIDKEISTKYSDRCDNLYKKIAEKIETILSFEKNTIIFFPSYKFLEDVISKININFISGKILKEVRHMSKENKEKFIDHFKKSSYNKVVLFGVLGGSFSEGLDLPNEFLEVVVVIGLPLAPIDIVIKSNIQYFENKFKNGEDYGYLNPAMTKMIQAAGRCIRSEKDKGVIILMDNRYLYPKYKKFIPNHFNLKTSLNLKNELNEFF
jgi:DNA excision repair protein ERCC-2